MANYAKGTEVGVDRSRAEIERILTRYGASQFMYGWDHSRAILGFVAHNRQVRFLLPLPSADDAEFHRTATGQKRTPAVAQKAHEQAIKEKWRALVLVIKAKLEAVDSGIVGFEQEFLSHIVLPDGSTVGDQVLPKVEEAYESGGTPQLLPSYPRAIES